MEVATGEAGTGTESMVGIGAGTEDGTAIARLAINW